LTLIIWSFPCVSSNSSDSPFVGFSICWGCIWETVPLARSCGVILGAGFNSGAARLRPAGREGEEAALRDFADEDAISGVVGVSLLLLRLRFENQRMWDEELIIFVNFVKLGKFDSSLPNLTDFNRVWPSLLVFEFFTRFHMLYMIYESTCEFDNHNFRRFLEGVI
jgi:hypothetical protein